MSLDTVYTVQTPEVVDINLRPAGVISRVRAFLIDFFIRVLLFISYAYFLFSATESDFMISLSFIFLFALIWLYPVLFETFWNGQTPGKRILGIRVVQDNGSPITFSISLIRNLLRIVDSLPFFYGAGMICMLLHPQFRRCADIVSGSMVIYTSRPKYKVRKILSNTVAVEAPLSLSKNERMAILSFIERLPKIPAERAQELANHLLQDTDIPENQRIDTIKSWAKSILWSEKVA